MAKRKTLTRDTEAAIEEGQSVSSRPTQRTRLKKTMTPEGLSGAAHEAQIEQQAAVLEALAGQPGESSILAKLRSGSQATAEKLAAERAAAAAEAQRQAALSEYLAGFARPIATARQVPAALAPTEFAMARTAPEIEAQLATMASPAIALGAASGSLPAIGSAATTGKAAASSVPTPLAGLGAFMKKQAASAATKPAQLGKLATAKHFLAKNKALAIPAGILAVLGIVAANRNAAAQKEQQDAETARQMAMAEALRQSQANEEAQSMAQAMQLYNQRMQGVFGDPVHDMLQEQAMRAAQSRDYMDQLNQYLGYFAGPEYAEAGW